MPRVKGSAEAEAGILAVTLTFRIVEALANHPPSLGVTELARRLDATKARVYRHLLTLCQAGYVAQDLKTEKYQIGSRMIALAHLLSSNIDLVSEARKALLGLRDRFGHTTILAAVAGDTIRVLDVALGTSDYAIVQRAGNTLQPNTMHCSALGKIALAFGPKRLMEEQSQKPLRKMTENTITSVKLLKREIEQVRKRGWAMVPDESIVGFNAIAVPILDAHSALAAMIGVIGPTRALSVRPPPELIEGLKKNGAALSHTLGWREPAV
jgi:DNA-binding IclR family transcriptional regulator